MLSLAEISCDVLCVKVTSKCNALKACKKLPDLSLYSCTVHIFFAHYVKLFCFSYFDFG